jgi:hypothetical protein
MYKFITKRKREIDGKSENDYSVESQKLKSVTFTVPTCDVSMNSVDSCTSKSKIHQKM